MRERPGVAVDFALASAVKNQSIDVDKFMELWALLSSQGLLQALEAAAGKTVSLYLFDPAAGGPKVEMLVDVTDGRAGVDRGDGARWGRWVAEGGSVRIVLDDGSGEYVLSGDDPGARMSWLAKA
jgi:hypothetical protein